MPVVPINPDFTNIPAFVDSLFDPDVRAAATITDAIAAGALTVAFSDQLAAILPVWTAAWAQSQGLSYDAADFAHCPASDAAAIAFLADYIGAADLSLYLPTLALADAPAGAPPSYTLSGYTRNAFKPGGDWDMTVVTGFLELLYYGAHFVAVHAAYDLAYGQFVDPLWARFRDSSALAPYRRWDPGNSHYTSVTNICGYYVPDITQDTAPADCPLLVALLCAPTVSNVLCNPSMYNSFLQLEGWEAIYARHNADYAVYKETLWNISTFGACAYSEKRGTAIFLAPADWAPQPSLGTMMPPYYGAEPVQPWLNTSLVALPEGYATTVVRGSTKPVAGNAYSVPFPLVRPDADGTLAWSVRHAPAGTSIVFDLLQGGRTILRDIADGSNTVAVAPGDYTIGNVRGGNSLSAYFEVVVSGARPGQ